jgi:hypothetical protein
VLAAMVWGAPADAQIHAGHDEHTVLMVVEQVFDGMRTANADLVREVMAPGVRFAGVGDDGTVTVQPVDGWLNAIGTSGGRWDEQIYDVEVQVDGDMASVWAPFTFYLDGAISHCGINSIELMRDATGWKITQIADTRRTEGCPDPLGR